MDSVTSTRSVCRGDGVSTVQQTRTAIVAHVSSVVRHSMMDIAGLAVTPAASVSCWERQHDPPRLTTTARTQPALVFIVFLVWNMVGKPCGVEMKNPFVTPMFLAVACSPQA